MKMEAAMEEAGKSIWYIKIDRKIVLMNIFLSNKPSDGLIHTYDQHEDSVYNVAWSPADTWTFASISYAGRVVISQVPTNEKFKILGV